MGGRCLVFVGVLAACGGDSVGASGTDATESSETSATSVNCNVGSQGCTCTVGGACDAGLECNDGVCLPSDTTSSAPTVGSESESESQSSSSPTTTTDNSDSSGASSSSSDSGIPEGCGDDELEPPEECDDGNNASGDGCNADCTLGGQVVWEHAFDGPYAINDWGNRLAVDSQDNVVVAGVAFAPNTNRDGWVIKLDDDGQFEWDEFIDSDIGNSNDGLYAIAVGPSDEVIVGGYLQSDDNTGDAIVRCYSADGDVLWTHIEPGEFYDDQVFAIEVDPAGDVVVLGNAHDPMDGSPQTWLMKLTIDGDPVWSEVFFDGVYGGSFALAVDSTGAIIHGGSESPAYISKLSDDAQDEAWLWESGFDGTRILDLAVDGNDDVFAGGTISSNPPHSRLARNFGNTGDPDWDVEWLGGYGAFAQTVGVAVDAEGRPVTVGSHAAAMQQGVFVRKYDTDGDEVWLYERDGAPLDLLTGVAIDSTGHVLASGTQQQANFQDDIWIVKLTP